MAPLLGDITAQPMRGHDHEHPDVNQEHREGLASCMCVCVCVCALLFGCAVLCFSSVARAHSFVRRAMLNSAVVHYVLVCCAMPRSGEGEDSAQERGLGWEANGKG